MSTGRQSMVNLTITGRDARLALGAFRVARKKHMREYEKGKAKGFIPAPGKVDANLMRVGALDRMMDQIEAQLGEKP